MKYYANFDNGVLVDIDSSLIVGDNVANTEVPQELYEDYKLTPNKYIAGEKEIEIIDYDDEGNPIGSHPVTVPYPIIDPDYEEKSLKKAKANKYEEAKTKAYAYLESGEALYEFEPNKHIEATDGNIGKFTAYALGFMAGSTAPVVWSTKEDETVTLDAEQVTSILRGLGAVQAQVWTVKFTDYVTEIQEATTVEEIEAILIDYNEE